MFTGSGVSVLAIDRSAIGTTVVSAVALLGVVGSNSVAVAVAVFEIVPPAGGGVMTIEIGGAAPTASVGRVHVTVPTDGVQLHPVPVAETSAEPGGSGSVTVTTFAVDGPALETPIV